MSFLWLTRFVPYPPRHGGAFNYTADLIDHLAELTEINVLCYDDPPDAARPRPGLFWTKLPRRRAPRWKSAVSSQPNIAEQFRQPAFIEAMLQLADAADAVILDHLAMAWCAAVLAHHFAARKGRRRRPPLLFIPHDHHKSVRHQAARQVRNPLMRALVTWDAIKATRLEHQAVELCDGVVVLTDADADQFRVEHPKTRYLTVQPGYNGRVVAQRSIDAAVPERICVLGGRGSFHKQIVLRQCLDALQRQGAPAPYVDVVGHIEDDLRSALQARYPSLNFLGFVDDIEDYLATVRLGVLPDAVGGGFKLRALTYAFNRVPMLAVKGALAGSGFTAGENYIETAQLDDLVNAARAVVGNFAELNRIQDNAFRYCESRFDWRRRAADLHTFAIGLRAEMPAPAC